MEYVLSPIDHPYPKEIGNLLDKYPKQQGYLLKLFRTFGHSARFLQKGMPNLLDKQSPLSMRDREIVILRVCANNRCEYEWGVHVAIFAKHAEFSEEQIVATCSERIDDSLWPNLEALLLTVVDEICHQSKLNANTLIQFRQTWTQGQQLEIFALCGAYHTVSFVANNADLPLEDFSASFPPT